MGINGREGSAASYNPLELFGALLPGRREANVDYITILDDIVATFQTE